MLILAIALKSPRVQTKLVGYATDYIENAYGVKAKIGKISFDIFDGFLINDLLINDLPGDTLFFANEIAIIPLQLKISTTEFYLASVRINKPYFRLVVTPEGKNNLYGLMDSFGPSDTTKKNTSTLPFVLKAKHVEIINARFVFEDSTYAKLDKGMDFSHIRVDNFNLNGLELTLINDSVYLDELFLSGYEKCGFNLLQLQGKSVIHAGSGLQVLDMEIRTDNSKIEGDLIFHNKTYSSYLQFNDSVRIKGKLVDSDVSFKDIGYFAPDEFYNVDYDLNITGKFQGTVNDYFADSVRVFFGGISEINASCRMKHATDPEHLTASIKLNRIYTNSFDLSEVPNYPFIDGKNLEIPETISALGPITANGYIEGSLSQLETDLKLHTAIGDAIVSAALSTVDSSATTKIEGIVNGNDFDLGKLFDASEYVQTTSADANVLLEIDSSGSINAFVDGNIASIGIKNYEYQDIKIKGNFIEKKFDGFFEVNDKNVQLNFNGKMDFNEDVPFYNFKAELRNAELHNLNLLKDTIHELNADLDINFKGSKIDNLVGSVIIENIDFIHKEKKQEIRSFMLLASQNNNVKELNVISDLVDLSVKGDYTLESLPASIQHLLATVFPLYFPEMQTESAENQKFSFDVRVKKINQLLQVFYPDVDMPLGTSVIGDYDNGAGTFNLTYKGPYINYSSKHLKDVDLRVSMYDKFFKVTSHASKLSLSDSTYFENFDLLAKSSYNNLQFNVTWSNDDGKKYAGDLSGFVRFLSLQKFEVDFFTTSILLDGNEFKISDGNQIVIDSTDIDFSNFTFFNDHQKIQFDGTLSVNPEKSFTITMDSLNLSALNLFTHDLGFDFGGSIIGYAVIRDPYDQLVFNANMSISEFYLNNQELGNGLLTAFWKKDQKAVDISATFKPTGVSVDIIKITGLYKPFEKKEQFALSAKVNNLAAKTFQPILSDIAEIESGKLTGTVNFNGNADEPVLTGKVDLFDAKVRIDYLNTTYALGDNQLIIQPDWIGFNNLELFDSQNNKGAGNITVFHNYFSGFNYDIYFKFDKLNILNTKVGQNDYYYGNMNMSGNVNLSGFSEKLLIEVTAKTEKGSKFNIPLYTSTDVSETDYISFVKPVTTQQVLTNVAESLKVNLDDIQMNLDIEVTNDAELQLIFDEVTGEVIKSKGAGNIKLDISSLGNFNMYGDYVINEGDYLFTLQNILNKRFIIEPGSHITWDGDPYNALLEIDAIYKVRTSVSEFSGIVADSSSTSRKVPVEVWLGMNGPLETPIIGFDIKFPSLDETTANTIKTNLGINSQEGNEQALNKQVFALLLANQFFPTNATGGIVSSGAGQSTMEVISNQLSNWMSKISNQIDLGVNYSLSDELSPAEVQVAISTQLLNNRISVETNIGGVVNNNGSSAATQTNSPLVGDINIEYKISEDGKFKAKFYNKSNDVNDINNNNTPYTQGVGVFYREEFNTWGELFQKIKRRFSRKSKKQVSP